MNKRVVISPTKPGGWSRGTSFGSNNTSSSSGSSSSSAIPSPPSSELCALISFAYRLGSTVHINESTMVGNDSDVRREAKLLMSLSCSPPIQTDDEVGNSTGQFYNPNDSKSPTDGETSSTTTDATSWTSSTGRITPTLSVTSVSSGGSRRDTFCFTCPSLSLENTQRGESTSTDGKTIPGRMLSRTLKIDDQDAMRLSSEAMARNVIESFQKAIEWRSESWVDSLSRVLFIKEMELKNSVEGSDIKNEASRLQQLEQELFYSNEALLVTALREIKGKIQVLEATTAFKVLNKVSQVDETGSALKKQRVGEEDRTGLEEGEYVYNVVHVLEMQCYLNISTPAGTVQIDLNVPGEIQGTFLSAEDDTSEDKLTDVAIHLNTDMMASMIEKSSRIAVRVSAETLLKGEQPNVITASCQEQMCAAKTPQDPQATPSTSLKNTVTPVDIASPVGTRSPKRKYTDDHNVSGLMVITPARNMASSPSSFGESSDSDTDPIRLQIPSNFPKATPGVVHLHAFRALRSCTPSTTKLDFAARLPPKKHLLQQKKRAAAVVTPLRSNSHEFIKREKAPNLPVLVEVACAAIKKK
eukprot:CAMPEP_0172396294 /NCGR_PEP_ID=MMETSP1061-20121228/24329_1 /TAXON_ID=37318 /ORGANISM="Pseudo-nitzschia pungens, Strain cf. pungens" /LENGTH=583 /DNA_ID=CAMNT_0013128099 /DNA_START=176 /DNA_END=1927 /DNA_ORIENTATION=-